MNTWTHSNKHARRGDWMERKKIQEAQTLWVEWRFPLCPRLTAYIDGQKRIQKTSQQLEEKWLNAKSKVTRNCNTACQQQNFISKIRVFGTISDNWVFYRGRTLTASTSSAVGRTFLTVQGLEVGVLVQQLRMVEIAVSAFSLTLWPTSSRSLITMPDWASGSKSSWTLDNVFTNIVNIFNCNANTDMLTSSQQLSSCTTMLKLFPSNLLHNHIVNINFTCAINHFQYTQTLFKPKNVKTFKLPNTLILLLSNQLFSKFM